MHRKLNIAALLMFVIFSGCTTGRNHGISQINQRVPVATQHITAENVVTGTDTATSLSDETSVAQIQLTSYQEEALPVVDDSELIVSTAELASTDISYSLEYLEEMAMANNPTLVQATTQIEAARSAAFQAGLYPNPVIGYSGEIDRAGNAGDETFSGGFIEQEFVTGGKLRLSRQKWFQRSRIAETNFHAQQHRVRNDVRTQFYRTLAAQKLVKIHHELLANGEDNLLTQREMHNIGQTSQAGYLKGEIELQRDRLNLKQTENEFQHSWRTLMSLVGSPELTQGVLVGSIKATEQPLDWDSALSQLLSSSPEIQSVWQKIQHDRMTVEREQAEPIPNLLVSVTTLREPTSNITQTTLNFGLPLPIFDRNQGTVRQAQADLTRSHAEARRLELELRNRLATQFRDYETSWQRVEDYETTILPKAEEIYDLLGKSYNSRRVAWPEVLVAQREFLNLRAEQIVNHTTYRESDVAIRGMLLSGGLTEPASPVGGGHIDAVPKPR